MLEDSCLYSSVPAEAVTVAILAISKVLSHAMGACYRTANLSHSMLFAF